MKALLTKLYDETVRIERTILIAGAIGSGDAFPEDLNDFFDDNDDKTISRCLGATPVMTPTGKNSRSYSWGYYSTTWIYAETIEDAVNKGLKWVKERRRAEDRKAKAKNGGEA